MCCASTPATCPPLPARPVVLISGLPGGLPRAVLASRPPKAAEVWNPTQCHLRVDDLG
eukprot:CAMPEP_0114128052 /NCGR_PEP_ID=MMETSP0043_2-20121206/10723_1 /TAXON_ID=464988 /ORGANISM="Hemiselmis andersenii, Strain CCMP644" /LENGTH=57 /DNA_ID=CAMNT_0001221209 /DNA_START=259 /DNA_END=432 /DNA_ORIENTATION=+